MLTRTLPALGSVKAIVAVRGYRGLNKMAAKQGIMLDIKAPPKGTLGFTPIAPLYRVEHAFARLGRWRRVALLRGIGGERPGLARGRRPRPPVRPATR